MKLALITLLSCLIAVSWQQYQHQAASNSYYWSQPHHQLSRPFYYQAHHQNYPPFYPNYYRGPYNPSAAQSYPNYYQQQQQFYKPQQQQYVPHRSQLDELKLAALLSQLSQGQQNEQPVLIVQQENDDIAHQSHPVIYFKTIYLKYSKF